MDLSWLDDFLWTYQNVIHSVGINGLLALSMYVVLAVGQLSLGQAAFMGLGAYSAALMTLKLGWPFWMVLPLSCVVPILFALAIGLPTLRLSGVYLAIATVGLGEVLKALYVNIDYVGGALGLTGIPEATETWMIYGLLALAVLAFWLVARSGIGRAMEAIREDETAARVMGVSCFRYQLGALVVSAMLAGIAGALEAHSTSLISPGEFGFEPEVSILSFALLGGIGTPIGPVVGAFILTLLPELLRGMADLRLVFNGVIIVVAVLFMPEGLVALRLRRRSA